jgi:CheY-like chemotaxis protein
VYKVVIAGSETTTRKKLEKALGARDLKVESVADGPSALKKVIAGQPDLVLLDVATREMNGMEVLRELRNHGVTSPVVMLVGNEADKTKTEALKLGANDYITKPFDSQALLVRVRRALETAARDKLGRRRALEVPLRELHHVDSGRIDAAKVAEYLGVPLQRVADALGANYQTLYKTPDGVNLQKGLGPIKRSLELIAQATRDRSEARAWLNNPHPHLGGRLPMDVILAGQAGAVVTMLENALVGLPA